MGLPQNGAPGARPCPLTAMIALVVPLAVLVIAIRRNNGVFAAFLLLALFVVARI